MHSDGEGNNGKRRKSVIQSEDAHVFTAGVFLGIPLKMHVFYGQLNLYVF